ncbi:Hypothetical predicted protein [Marmota monax]|uniref:Retroviral envelope protein GP41-like domain-containing protein n=1 Tax=Marmota monax TaxID=9995 RepID=A0A5E4AXC0_MARMO|nr:hypothetical protein GHT09_015242 [Marmota monax]VTJ61411.1 Hypothetical predicted protein [Marmota monax]
MLQQQIDLIDEKIDRLQLNVRVPCSPQFLYNFQTPVSIKNVTEALLELANRLKGPWDMTFRNFTMMLHAQILSLNETRAKLILNPSILQWLWDKLSALIDPANWILAGIGIVFLVLLYALLRWFQKRLNKVEIKQGSCM